LNCGSQRATGSEMFDAMGTSKKKERKTILIVCLIRLAMM
jgi:hypothetical protein